MIDEYRLGLRLPFPSCHDATSGRLTRLGAQGIIQGK